MTSTPIADTHPARQAWVNGELLGAGDVPRVSILDRGYLLGDSIFETLRVRDGHEVGWALHFQLLARAAAAFGLDLRYSAAALGVAAREVASRVGNPDVTIRVTLSRGVGGQGVSPRGCVEPMLTLLARPTTPYPAAAYVSGIDSHVLETRRIPSACLDSRFKTGCYLPAVMAKTELDRLGAVEGLMLTIDGRLASGAVSNVFFVRDGVLCTPSLSCDCREGVTRSLVLAAAARERLAVEEVELRLEDLTSTSEMFFTNTLMECLPVRSLGSQHFGPPGPVTRALLAALRAPGGAS